MAEERSAVIVVDVQKDFCPGGSLAVPNGDRVVAILSRVIEKLAARGVPVYASRDWHPPVTMHFKAYGGIWPPHCVAGTDGAGFHPDLRLPPAAILVTKGDRPDTHGYSAFEGRTPAGERLLADLGRRGVGHIYVGGLATDYCVRCYVLEALKAGLRVSVLTDAIAGVDVQPGDSEKAIREMEEAGARFVRSDSVA